MARVTIENCWWTDPRRTKLTRILGDEDKADARAARMWNLAQKFWENGRDLIPLDIFQTLESWQELIDCRLADLRGEFVYVRGSSQYLEWAYEQKIKRVAGGKKSAQRPRDPKGRLLPAKVQDPSKTPPSGVQDPSSESTYSGSGSGINEDRINNQVDAESLQNFSQPTSTQIHEARFNPELTGILEVLKQAYKKDPPVWRRKQAARILAHFGSPEDFALWVTGVINTENCPDPAKSFSDFEAYFGKSLMNVLGGA